MAKDPLVDFTEEELYETIKPASKAGSEKGTGGTGDTPQPDSDQLAAFSALTPNEIKALSFYQKNRTVILTVGVIAVVCLAVYLYQEHEEKKKRTAVPGRGSENTN